MYSWLQREKYLDLAAKVAAQPMVLFFQTQTKTLNVFTTFGKMKYYEVVLGGIFLFLEKK